MIFHVKTDKGKVRTNNEDSYYVPYPLDSMQNLFMVADGMGGHNAGEVASTLAIAEAARVLNENYDKTDPCASLRKAILDANKVVYDAAKANDAYKYMGTTMCCAIVEGDQLFIVNVGDSRAYLYSSGTLRQITKDNSYVQELIDAGSISIDEAFIHPDRNKITKCVGVDGFVIPDTYMTTWKNSDILLLCTDGLSSMIQDDKILEIIKNSTDTKTAVTALVAAAKRAGGKDNITCICIVNGGENS